MNYVLDTSEFHLCVFVLESFFFSSKTADICFNKIKGLERFEIEFLDLYHKFPKNQAVSFIFTPDALGLIPGNYGSSVNFC